MTLDKVWNDERTAVEAFLAFVSMGYHGIRLACDHGRWTATAHDEAGRQTAASVGSFSEPLDAIRSLLVRCEEGA